MWNTSPIYLFGLYPSLINCGAATCFKPQVRWDDHTQLPTFRPLLVLFHHGWVCFFYFEEVLLCLPLCWEIGFPVGSAVKNLPSYSRDTGLIPRLGGSLGEGDGYTLQYSCLRNPIDRGALWAIVHRVAKSQAWLSD